MPAPTPSSPSPARSAPRRAATFSTRTLAEIGLVFVVFAVYAGWPVPDVNEAHYLTKARHFWGPGWIAGDFFLDTADAHAAFYWSVGWLTLLLPLPAAACVLRIVTWWLLAWSWRRMSAAIEPRWGLAVLSAGLFVCLLDVCEMAGEWVVGGVEAKGFAYALVFLSLEALIRNRWTRALLLLGAATSFHVLVGGWTAAALLLVWLWLRLVRSPTAPAVPSAGLLQDLPSTKDLLPGVVGAALLALPGLWAVLRLDWDAPAEIARQANAIYVFDRLRHHLLPQAFPVEHVLRFLLLTLAWLLLCGLSPFREGERRLRLVVAAALAIAIAGWFLSFLQYFDKPLAAGILRFYWFRMSDALLPLGTALTAASFIAATSRRSPAASRFVLGAAVAIAGAHFLDQALLRMLPQRPRGEVAGKVASLEDWIDVCSWIDDNAPRDARFITPRMQQTFKWRAQRAEVVNWKDIPQDARGIVAWWRRLKDVHWTGSEETGEWRRSLTEAPPEELLLIGRDYGARYLLTEAEPPLPFKRLYPPADAEPAAYAVYELPPPAR